MGRVCVFHRGGGHKRLYSRIDLIRRTNCYGRILRVFRDNYRTAFLAQVIYDNGLMAYHIHTEGAKAGNVIFSGAILPKKLKSNIIAGSAVLLGQINLFMHVSCIEYIPTNGIQIARAAGMGGLLVARNKQKTTIKLSSGWLLSLNNSCIAAIGRCSNNLHKYDRLRKAGSSRFFGIRPTVRGIIKNPCDHPHGGGEGKNSPPAAQLSPWSKLTKGTPTTNTKRARIRRRLYKNIKT